MNLIGRLLGRRAATASDPRVIADPWQPTGEWHAKLPLAVYRGYRGEVLKPSPGPVIEFTVPANVLASRSGLIGTTPDIKWVGEMTLPERLTGEFEWLDVCQVIDGVRREAHLYLGARQSIKDGTLTILPGNYGTHRGSVTDTPVSPGDPDPCWDPRRSS